MKKGFKRLGAAVLAASMAMSLAACGGSGNSGETSGGASAGGESGSNGEIKTISMYTMGIGNTTDYKMVQDAINEISREKIGVEVDWTVLDIGQWFEQYNLLLSGSESVDLMPNLGGIANGVRQGAFLEMEDLYAEYGQDIATYYYEAFLNCGFVNGHLYGIAGQKDFAATTNITYRQDIVDELGLDVSNVTSLEDWEPIMAAVQEAYPNMSMFVSNGGNSLNQFNSYNWDTLGDGLGVLLDYGEGTEVVNLYESDIYYDIVKTMERWYNEGYVAKDTATSPDNYGNLIKAGNAFCSITTGNPGIADEASTNTGYPMGSIAITEPLSGTPNVTTLMWSIPVTSKEPEAAMMFLNLMYSDSDVSNLLNYGIEGTHYQVQEDGKLNYLEGQDGGSCTYHPEMTWIWPNTYIAGQWATATEDLGTKMRAFNESSKKSSAMGFTFDSSAVANQITACSNVVQQYAYGLEVGAVDVDTVLPQFQQALKDAGIDAIIAEKQAQLDAWLAQ